MVHPTEADLRLLLADRLSPERTEAIADHLDACERCRDAAESLTAVPREFWSTFLGASGRGSTSAVSAESPTITGFEDFRLLGRGGGGVVYLATESASGRKAAVKLLRGGATASPRERAGFLNEARAVANLRHRNIVTVLAVGEEGGQPFFVMDYHPDGSLADRLDGEPIAPAQAAAFVSEVAGAIQYAHDAGVIHRDLKPGNILLDASTRPGLPWTPKVADFGMAKLKEATARSATPTQAVFGTPGYMAPEQAFGRSRDVGPTADVYALGAILYELLTGRPPFRAGTSYEALVMIREQEPAPPGRLRPGLPKDLETVCLKCLEKDANRRYASASALRNDLEAFLAGRPVVARPVGRLGRLERWVRREPVVAGLAGAAILLAAILFAVVTTAWRRAVAQQVRLAEAMEKAEARGDKLFESLVFSAEATSKLFLHPSLVSQLDREILIRGLEVFEQVPDLPDSPEKEYRLAYAMLQMAAGLYDMGETDHSGRAARRAHATFERLMGSTPDRPLFAYHYAESCMQLAGLERAAGRLDEEMRLHAEALRVVEELVERHPKNDAYASYRAVFQSRVAQDLIERGRVDEAEPLLVQSLAGLRELIDRYPHDPVRYEYFRNASYFLGLIKLRRGDAEGYEKLVLERLEMCDRARSQKDWPLIFRNLLLEQASIALQRLGREQTAEKVVSYALAAWRETVARDPASPHSRVRLVGWLVADGYRALPSDPSAAGDAFRQALAILEPLIDGPERSEVLSSLAWLRGVCPDPSIRDPEKVVAYSRAFKAEFDPRTFGLGVCLFESGEYEEARAELEGCLAEPHPWWRSYHEKLVRLYLALACRKLGMPDRAAEEIRAAQACPMEEGTVDCQSDAATRRVEALLDEQP